MERVILSKQKSSPNFIGSWLMQPTSLCNDLVMYFDANSGAQSVGKTSEGRDLKVKDRLDISIYPNQLKAPKNKIFISYMDSLFSCYKDYLMQWPALKQIGSQLEIGMFNLGKYTAGQHFQGIHAERSGLDTLHRVLAWMTYLNDVDEGGETYFPHYDLGIKPKKGLTIIWPSEWTHCHRGNVVKGGVKYMITGWMNFTH